MYNICDGADRSKMLIEDISNYTEFKKCNFDKKQCEYINLFFWIAGPYMDVGRERVNSKMLFILIIYSWRESYNELGYW